MNSLNFEKSLLAFEQANKVISGGVNSPVRAFRAVNGNPFFVKKAQGAFIFDLDNNRYIDYVLAYGPLILGHRHPEVVHAIEKILCRGMSYGAPTEEETILAQMIIEAYPSIELVRLVNSGTEAAMSAIRVARGFTNRNKIVKFAGCYHGHADYLLVKAGSGSLTFGVPDSAGVSASITSDTMVIPFNNMETLEEVFKCNGDEIACVIIEPVVGNMGVVIPEGDFLEKLREITLRYGSLLIFDEVMTGFRVSYGGVQEIRSIKPDLTCLGKVIGGGLPIGAYGGKREIMEKIAPLGPVYQAGTLSGNPLSVSAGIATLKTLISNKLEIYTQLNKMTEALCKSFETAAKETGIPCQANHVCSMFTFFFTENKIKDLDSALKCDTKIFGKFHSCMLKHGISLPPSQFEACFLSAAHSEKEIDFTCEAIYKSLKEI